MNNRGFSVIEIILAVALFTILATGGVTVIVQSFRANRLGNEQTIASQYASEGIEAVKSIRNQAFSNLTAVNPTPRGINNPSTVWQFTGDNTTNTFSSGKTYTRTIKVEDVQRNSSCNIIASGGTTDPTTKKITSTVNWTFGPNRNNSVVFTSYLNNWRNPLSTQKGGMLVYADSATASDAMLYKILDAASGTWMGPYPTADVDASTNRTVRALRLYASSTRNEKVLISRHYNGTTQYIYTQVYNGICWNTPRLLASWNAATALGVRNFDGTYLNNGNFMVIFSNNTTTPQYQIWDGTSWTSSAATTNVGGVPLYIVARARPGTNEIMMGVFDQSSHTNTAYYSGSAWSAATQHSAVAPTATKEHIDFAWSPQDTLRGMLIYTDAAADRAITMRMWSADGSGGGSWGTAVNASPNQSNNLGALALTARKGANEFHACNKDAGSPFTIRCNKATFTSATPSVITATNPTNQTIAAATDNGIQRSFDLEFKAQSGALAIAVYSDNTASPKLKKFTPGSPGTWDAAATPISTAPFTLGNPVRTVRLIPDATTDDIMILMGDNTLDVYSVVWSGSANAVYTTPAGKAFSRHGQSGSVATDFWYNFAWDKF